MTVFVLEVEYIKKIVRKMGWNLSNMSFEVTVFVFTIIWESFVLKRFDLFYYLFDLYSISHVKSFTLIHLNVHTRSK